MTLVDALELVNCLDRFGRTLPALVGEIGPEEARWQPAGGGWSILEIVCHLADEEVDDFRTRLALTLEDASRPWPPIDPEGWARERRYNDGHLADAVERFVSERRASVGWLRGLTSLDVSARHDHSRFGAIHAGDLLSSWAAHDALHLRQIAKRLYQLACRAGDPYRTDYAGSWGP